MGSEDGDEVVPGEPDEGRGRAERTDTESDKPWTETRQRPDLPSTPYEPTPDPRDGLGPAVQWFRTSESAAASLVRDVVVSLLVVVGVGLLLYGVSGVWPPLVAVESDSMEPHLQKGDLVLVVDEGRFAPDYAATDTGVVTAEAGLEHDYRRFGGPGDVIVYRPNGVAGTTPIIHRAHLYVESGENWYDQADQTLVDADSCEGLAACPAPSTGFVTKGDNEVTNDYYDQQRGISGVVQPEWVRGRAVLRIPWLGWIRLAASDLEVLAFGPALLGTTVLARR